jgi:hypothetical protein
MRVSSTGGVTLRLGHQLFVGMLRRSSSSTGGMKLIQLPRGN